MTSTATDFALAETTPSWYFIVAILMAAAWVKDMRGIQHGPLRDANANSKTLARNVQLLGSTSTQMAVRINALPTSTQLARLQRIS